jgi:nucleoid-associated protein YgaU
MRYSQILLVLFIGICLLPAFVFGQDPRLKEWTMDMYDSALAVAEKRLQDAQAGIAQEQARIEELKSQIAQVETQIAETIAQTYALLGITQEDVDRWMAEADAIKAKIEEMMMLSSDELAARMNEIREIEKRIAELKKSRISWLFDCAAVITELESLLQQLKSNLPDKPMQYTVRLIPERRDCLWRISGYEEIYGDPYQWPSIYSANKSKIDRRFDIYQSVIAAEEQKYTRSEDLIYPGQVFDIPR